MGRVRTSFLACQIKEFLTKKSRCRRGRESLTNIFHLLLKHDDDEQGRGASLTSIKHHYKNTPFQYLERRRNSTSGNNWWLAKAAKKGNILLLSLGKIFAKFLRCHSHFFCFGKGTRKSAFTTIISSCHQWLKSYWMVQKGDCFFLLLISSSPSKLGKCTCLRGDIFRGLTLNSCKRLKLCF